ncbi:uncharacterized protein [Anoplolepis gracilipes]|uniref:uncharacterized protein n=1 Tax=Anoplolepis gracilipes TaxID=354296 RepID=UPI003BA3226D
MINITTKYFSWNKILLLGVGLWPYKQSNLTRLQFIFLSSILSTNVIFQCTIFVSHRCTPDLIIKVLSFVCFLLLSVIHYNMFSVKAMKDLFEQLLHVCNGLKDEKEIAIINEYGRIGKHYTVALTVIGIFSIFIVTIASLSSDIFNVILSSTNVSRSHRLMIMTEYFIDQEKYFYFILFHFIASASIGVMSSIAIGTTFITYLHHVCGMLKIASYRIECAMSIDMLRNINHKRHILIKILIYAVDIHRQALKLSKHLQYSCETMMFCLVTFGVLSLSLNLFQIASFGEELLVPFLCAFAAIVYMFIANYIGQIITNHNNDVFVTVYNVRWYVAPLYIQRMILFLLQRNSKTFTLNVGGLFVSSIECFATV